MKDEHSRRKAAEILFDLLVTLDPRILTLRQWYISTIETTERWFRSEGSQGVKRMKDALFWAWKHVLGEKTEPLPFVQSNRSGCPLVVNKLVSRVDSLPKDPRLMSSVQTLVRLTDLWEGVPEDAAVERSLSIISDSRLPGTAKLEIERFRNFLPLFLSAYPDHPFVKAFKAAIRLTDENRFLYRESRGPNGPLIGNAHFDYVSVANSRLKDGRSLLEEVHALQDHIGAAAMPSWCSSYDFDEAMNAYGLDRLIQENPGKIRSTPGKLSFKPEKSGKVRLIAQPDYFTQVTLKPVHDWLSSCLRALVSDHTYDQRSALPHICEWQEEGGGFTASFDQSACTDRFPFDYQIELLRAKFGDVATESFKAVIADREWEVKLPSGKVRKVRWSVGQPLGMYGSWPLMAVTHHLLIQYCYWITRSRTFQKRTPFSKYAICGDDIVIADKAVARQYLALCKRLGMVVNLSKSHVSGGSTGVPPVSEFTKVTIWRGTPLTPLKPNLVLAACSDVRNAVPLLTDLATSPIWAPRKALLERTIKKHFPKEKRFLTALLTTPLELGGLGFRDDRSIRCLVDQLQTGEIHPYIWFIAIQCRETLKKYENIIASNESLASSIPDELFRAHPLRQFHKQAGLKDSLTAYLTKGTLPSVWEVCAGLLLHGFTVYEGWSPMDTPLMITSADSRKRDNKRQDAWHRAFLNTHLLPSYKVCSRIPRNRNLVELIQRISEDPNFLSNAQVDLLERWLLAQRSATSKS